MRVILSTFINPPPCLYPFKLLNQNNNIFFFVLLLGTGIILPYMYFTRLRKPLKKCISISKSFIDFAIPSPPPYGISTFLINNIHIKIFVIHVGKPPPPCLYATTPLLYPQKVDKCFFNPSLIKWCELSKRMNREIQGIRKRDTSVKVMDPKWLSLV